MKNGQTQRIWDAVTANRDEEFSLPLLVAIAAGNGEYVTCISKRVSEVRKRAATYGWTFERTKDVTENGKRKTGYTLKTK